MSETKQHDLPARSDLPEETKWDLTLVFASDEDWDKAYNKLKEQLPRLAQFQGRLGDSAHVLADCIETQLNISEQFSKLYVYAHLKKDEDTTVSKHQAMEDRASSLGVAFAQSTSFIEPEIMTIPDETINRYMDDERLKPYRFYLEQMLRQKRHVLSEKEEALLAQVSEIARQPGNIYGMLNNADITFPRVTDEKGNQVQLSHGRYIQLLESKDRGVRESAFHAMYDTYKQFRNTMAATLQASVKKNVFYARVRNYESALAAALDQDNVPVSVYHRLIETVNKHLPLLHRYFALRKKTMGLDELHMYDIYAPMVSDVEMEVTYEKAQEMMLAGLKPLGEDYLSHVREALKSRWIDVYENKGKRSGAYSSGTYGTPPYILLNYTGKLNDLFTLTHEMGHSMHSYYSHQNQPYVYSDYTIFVAEVASTLNESLLNHYLLQETQDVRMKLYLLNHFLEGFRTTLYRQTMFAEFELAIHEKAEAGEALTADLLSEMYYELNKKYHGDVVVSDQDIAMEWARIPHFYYNFYVYKYATGFSAAAALSKGILEQGEPAVERYLAFLKSGGSDYPINLLKTAGVDMTSSQPIEDALSVFANQIDEMERLLAGQ